jgi:hypothetical protein
MEKAGYDGRLVVRRDLWVGGLEGTTLQRSVCQRVGRVAGQTKRWSQTAYGGSLTGASCNGHWRWSLYRACQVCKCAQGEEGNAGAE